MGLSNYIASSRISQSGVCTSTTRPASPFEGQVIYETDTDLVLVWSGSAWVRPNATPLCILENTSVSAASGSAVTVSFSSEEVDSNNWHSTSTNTSRITPNIAGYYFVNLQVNDIGTNGTRALTVLYKNGAATNVPIAIDTPGTIDDFSTSGYVYVNGTTDYLEMIILQTNGSSTTRTCKCQFTVQFVR